MEFIVFLSGASTAAVIALFGAWLQHRREFKRWLHGRRFEAYESYLREVDLTHMRVRTKTIPKDPKGQLEAMTPVVQAVATLAILGPESVLVRASKLRLALAERINSETAEGAYRQNRSEYVEAVRAALAIRRDAGRTTQFGLTPERQDGTTPTP